MKLDGILFNIMGNVLYLFLTDVGVSALGLENGVVYLMKQGS